MEVYIVILLFLLFMSCVFFFFRKSSKYISLRKKIRALKKERRFKRALSDMKSILDQHEQHFFLVCGTFLGQFRDAKFIPHDVDIDIGVLRKTFDVDLKNKILNTKKFTLVHELGRLEDSYEISFLHVGGARVDIFLYYEISTDYYYHATFFGICEEKEGGFCKLASHIRGFRDVLFYGENYQAPVNAEEYLVELYGDDFMTPREFDYHDGLDWGYKDLIN